MLVAEEAGEGGVVVVEVRLKVLKDGFERGRFWRLSLEAGGEQEEREERGRMVRVSSYAHARVPGQIDRDYSGGTVAPGRVCVTTLAVRLERVEHLPGKWSAKSQVG